MVTSPRLGLSYIVAQQAQKHVTVNDSFRQLDALTQMTVASASLAAEPTGPANGEAFILPAASTGPSWSSYAENSIAAFDDGGWRELAPRTGWRAFVQDESAFKVFVDGVWRHEGEFAVFSRLGVNTAADETARLAVKSDSVSLSHDDVTPGSGDMRQLINKASSGNTGSVVFQTGNAAQAEMGLIGDDNLALRVSADGVSFNDGARFDRVSGAASFPSGVAHATLGAKVASLILTPGGDGVTSIYRIDAARAQNPRTATISSIASDQITLTTAVASTFFQNAYMQGVSFVRIWNTTKNPDQSAWVKSSPNASALQVVDAASIAGWLPGETIQIGDPTAETPGRVIALDISPMMTAVLGGLILQKGVLIKMVQIGTGGFDSKCDATGTGVSGTFNGVRTYDAGASETGGHFFLPTPTLSPISGSNLVFVRESTVGGQMGISIATLDGLIVE